MALINTIKNIIDEIELNENIKFRDKINFFSNYEYRIV